MTSPCNMISTPHARNNKSYYKKFKNKMIVKNAL